MRTLSLVVTFMLVMSAAHAQVGTFTGGSVTSNAGTYSLGDWLSNMRAPVVGASCDAIYTATGGSVAAGSNQLTGSFPSGRVGKAYAVQIPGAGANGNALVTTATINSTSLATLGVTATLAASSATFNASFMQVNTGGDGVHSYAPGDTVTVSGGTSALAASATINWTELLGATLSGGSGFAIGDKLFLVAANGTQIGRPSLIVTNVSGGAPTAFVLTDFGRFTSPSNPTGFTVASDSPTVGTGLTISAPIYGISRVPGALSLAARGSYTVKPSNMAVTTTNGSGQGAMVFLGWHQGGDYAYGTDNTAVINSAITQAKLTPGIGIKLPGPTNGGQGCGITASLAINASYLGLYGLSPPNRFVGLAQSAAVMWLGASDASMLSFAPTAGADPLSGNVVSDIAFLLNGVGGTGLSFTSANNFKAHNLYFQDSTIAGLSVTTTTGLTQEPNSQTATIDDIRISQTNAPGAGLVFDGNNTGDASYIDVRNVSVDYKNGEMLRILSADNLKVTGVQGNQQAGGIGLGVEVSCGGASFAGIDNSLDQITTGSSNGIVFRGTETCPQAALRNALSNYDVGNGSRAPILGVGATIYGGNQNGIPSPTLANGQVYYYGAVANSNLVTATATGSSGAYTMTVTSATNIMPGMASVGNTGITDGTIITAINGTTLSLSAPLTGAQSSASVNLFPGTELCPQDGGGLMIDGSLRAISNACVWGASTSLAGPKYPGGVDYVYIGHQAAIVTGAASSDATRNLVRLTLSTTAGFQTGNALRCFGISGTTEANSGQQEAFATGNLVDATHIDLQGVTFANAYTGGGYCEYFYLTQSTIGPGLDAGRVAVMANRDSLTLVGRLGTFVSGGATFGWPGSNGAGVASWFNRRNVGVLMSAPGISDPTTTSSSFGELNSIFRLAVLAFELTSPAGVSIEDVHFDVAVAVTDSGTGGCEIALGYQSTTVADPAVAPSYMQGTVKTMLYLHGVKHGWSGDPFFTILGRSVNGSDTCTFDHTRSSISVMSRQ